MKTVSDEIAGDHVHRYLFCLLFLVFVTITARTCQAEVQAPVLKWGYGGCYSSWCERGWYSSVAVADVNGDGVNDVVGSAYSVVALDGLNGDLLWRVKSGHDRTEPDDDNVGRTWPAIVVADINNDGTEEIVTAHGGGWVSVYDINGYFLPGWPKQAFDRELRGLLVADLDDDQTAEIVVSGAVYSGVNTMVYEHDGTSRSGWPQLDNDSGYAYGIFNDNAAAGDIDDDGQLELIVPSDVHYICAYNPDGSPLPSHPMYNDNQGNNKAWGKVGIWEDLTVELRGWGECDGVRSESYRTNFAHGAATVADVNGDNVPEVVTTGNVYDCDNGHPPGMYNGVYVFNADRSRFNSDGYNWEAVPVDTGSPLSEDYNEIESCQPNPVVADIDNDGIKEILFASYDGRMHVFWLDKTERHNWPHAVYESSEGFYRFASEPVVVDLDNDGFGEVLFGSWTQKDFASQTNGMLHILDYRGNVIHELELPEPKSTSVNWNGALAAPTLADIDDDDDLEIILNTAYSGFVAYDLPGTSEARVLWATGRAGRVWRPEMSNEERLNYVVNVLQTLAGEDAGTYPDTNGNDRTDMADALKYLKDSGE